MKINQMYVSIDYLQAKRKKNMWHLTGHNIEQTHHSALCPTAVVS
jgi:hypothetical protein